MEKQIETLMQDIKSDYVKWSTSNGTKPISSYTQGVLDKFDDNIEVKYGKKYIKIVGGVSSGVWGFIVNTDDDKCARGTRGRRGGGRDLGETILQMALHMSKSNNDKN